MAHNHAKKMLLFFTTLIFNVIVPINNSKKNQVQITQETYLKKFPVEILTSDEIKKKEELKQKVQMKVPFWPITIESKVLTKQDQLKSFCTNVKPSRENVDHIINPQTIEKLNILCAKTTNGETTNGETTKNAKHIDGFADTIATLSGPSVLGKVAFIHELVNPTNNVQTLHEKQALINNFISGELFTLKQSLHKAFLHEESIAHLWAYGHELIPQTMLPNVYWSDSMFASKFLPKHVVNYLDKTPIALLPTLIDVPVDIIGASVIGGLVSFGAAGIYATYQGYGKQFLNTIKALVENAGYLLTDSIANPIQTSKTICSLVKKIPKDLQIGFNNLSIEHKIMTAYTIYIISMITYNIENHFAHLQKYFIDFASFLNEVRAIGTFFQKNNLNFALAFPELQDLIDLDDKAKHSADFNQLIDLLKTGTFKGKASKFSYLGRVKCAYKLFMNVRQEFEPILYAIAKLQMYNGVAELMTASANKENTFCFAEFVDFGPHIEAVDFWNPMVGQNNAVSNSLLMTPDEKDIILHGPNTGGKTTTIKGLIYNILLAQTLGIGCASKLVLSPFAQINCFMDIQDDVNAGSSLFDAEVRFATELHNNVQSLKQGEYAFTIADEILRSTSPSKGQACAYQFTKKLAKNPNSMSITVTHYPKLVELATETPNNGFRTFHVEIKRENGKVIRTFKLKEGATLENIAGDILHKHGIFDTTDLAEVERLEQEFGV